MLGMMTHVSIFPLSAFLIFKRESKITFYKHFIILFTVIFIALAIRFDLLSMLGRSMEEVDFVERRKVGLNYYYFLAIWLPLFVVGYRHVKIFWIAFYSALLWFFVGDLPTSERLFVPLEILPIYYLPLLSGLIRYFLFLLIVVQGVAVFYTYSL
jgi:hypothetical protein